MRAHLATLFTLAGTLLIMITMHVQERASRDLAGKRLTIARRRG
jgi:hypothetical protein